MVGNLVETLPNGIGGLGAQDDRAIAIVEEGLRYVIEERQPVLHARVTHTFADGLVERVVASHRTEPGPVPRTKPRNRIVVEQDLARRQEHQARDRFRRQLAQGVETP